MRGTAGRRIASAAVALAIASTVGGCRLSPPGGGGTSQSMLISWPASAASRDSMDAVIGGRLKIAGTQCVSVSDPTATYVAVWPIGTTLESDGIRLSDGTLIADGMQIRAGGGYVTKADVTATGGPDIPAECAGDADQIAEMNPTAVVTRG